MQKFKRYTTIILAFILSIFLLSATANVSKTGYAYSAGIKEFFERLFSNAPANAQKEMPYVYLGGMPLGFTLDCNGVIVIAVGGVHIGGETISTIKEGNIESGDIIITINKKPITSTKTIADELASQNKNNTIVELEVLHDDKMSIAKILPAKDDLSGEYKLGLWVRDNSAGVGTLTYVKEDYSFGALGHSVCDIDTGKQLPVRDGNIYKCNIIGVNQSKKGSAGELKGLFLRNGEALGKIEKNNEYGVYGKANDKMLSLTKTKVRVASMEEVKTGRASIFSTIEGSDVKEYAIEIIKVVHQNGNSTKSMIIRITDQGLIEKTGGIVQGMSGSPIVQNGMLVGALTHVFVSDPTKGYGIYAEWMLNNN